MNKVSNFFSMIELKTCSLYAKAQSILNQKVLTISLGAFFKKPSPASFRKAVHPDLNDRLVVWPTLEEMADRSRIRDGDPIKLDLTKWLEKYQDK